MTTRYYIINPLAERGFNELTEDEWLEYRGIEEVQPYISKLYKNEITLTEVPEELRSEAEKTLNARINLLGLYSERPLTADEALKIILGEE